MISRFTKRLALPLVYSYRRYRARPVINHLKQLNEPILTAISLAVENTLWSNLSDVEKFWVSRIESRRAELLANHETIPVVDYGAGDKTTQRSLEDSAYGVPLRRTVHEITTDSKDRFHATLLFHLVRQFAPDSCIELGTCVGISTAYQAAALALNGSGSIVSLEGSPNTAKIAASTIRCIDLDRNTEIIVGPFHQTLSKSLTRSQPIDFFFNDGHHDGRAVRTYFEMALPFLAAPAIVFIDDIRWSKSMFDAWTSIRNDRTVNFSFDFGRTGLLVINTTSNSKNSYTLTL